MSFVHGRGAYFSLDDLDGALTDISAYLRSASGLEGRSDRPPTTTLGSKGVRRQVLGMRDGGPIVLGGPFNPAGSPIHGRNTVLLLDEYAATTYFRSGTISRSIGLPETHTFGDSWRERGAPGLKDGAVRLEGLFDSTATTGSDAIMRDLLAQEGGALFSVGLNGLAVGSLVEMGQVVQGEYLVPADVDGVVPVTAAFEGEDYFDLGVALHALSAETGTVNGASVNETEATADGGISHLHVTEIGGAGSITIKVQHSTDDSIWADLITHTAATAVTKERKATAAETTTVNQYVRGIVSAYATFTSVTFALAFARRGFKYGTAGRHRHFAGMFGNLQGITTPVLSYTFNYGPEGSAAGKRKLSGECLPTSYELNFSVDDVETFACNLAVTGAVAEGTF